MTKPIHPDEIVEAKAAAFPDGVIEAFNELIVSAFAHFSAIVPQKAVIERIMRKMNCDEGVVLDRGWLDVEDVYRKEGWIVRYEKPDIGENFPPRFIFSKPRPRFAFNNKPRS